MPFNDVVNRAWKELLPGVRIRSFWGEEMLVIHVELDEGAVVPRHSHPHEQGGTLIVGKAEFTIGEETRIVQPGNSYIIPGGVEHEVVALQPCRLFEIFSPVRELYKY